ncbi:citrulline utilization hydrolase CtlX [Desulfopila sp. IMCC35008]|uniref:citrulline utilization hydrolase CtlX n=1 Tax=Desulfopila sp. IMCC35008 TaxID=2653858 RepID=UPI0013D243D6|nr:arginine deiminase-related protein [Desulfopila sp. IMCC35008]
MALIQAPNGVVMIRPWRFHSNPETATDNAFQKASATPDTNVSLQARIEFDAAVETLKKKGVRVHVFDDFGERETPDSVFPNNWFSTHPGGHIAVYSMYSPSRRRERRQDVIEMLKCEYRVQDVIDYSGLEWDNLFLEGTGAMVLDHIERVAYTAKSNRASDIILERFCSNFQFEPMAFDTADTHGTPIYHTNVMMCIGTEFALICLEMIVDKGRRMEIRKRLENSGRKIVDLSFEQIDNFAGNALELTGNDGSILAMSQRAADALTDEQKEIIGQSAQIVPLSVPTIELAGGSVRCMLAGIHLTPRKL